MSVYSNNVENMHSAQDCLVPGSLFPPPILKVLVIGDIASGKSAFIASIMGFHTPGHDFVPTLEVTYWRKELEGATVLLVSVT